MIKLTDFKFFANTDGELYVSVDDLKKRLKEEYQIENAPTEDVAEIERLSKENEAFAKIIKSQDEEISELRKDLVKKQNLEESFSKSVKQFGKRLEKTVESERAEAVKEFADKLKKKCHNYYPSIDSYCLSRKVVEIKDIDNLVKEMEQEGWQ